MDFAFDFQPLNTAGNEMNINMNKPSPLVYLPFIVEKEINNNQELVSNPVNPRNIQNNQGTTNEIDQLVFETNNIINNLKVINKKVEIITKIKYVYEDGSTKEVTQKEYHEFKG